MVFLSHFASGNPFLQPRIFLDSHRGECSRQNLIPGRSLAKQGAVCGQSVSVTVHPRDAPSCWPGQTLRRDDGISPWGLSKTSTGELLGEFSCCQLRAAQVVRGRPASCPEVTRIPDAGVGGRIEHVRRVRDHLLWNSPGPACKKS